VIYGHIPRWVAEENPEFAKAVAQFYSLEHGTVKSAARGELAWDALAAEFLLSRPVFRDADPAFYGPLLDRAVSRATAQMEALQRGDANYFRRRAAAVEALPGSGVKDMQPREFIFERVFVSANPQRPGFPFALQRRRQAIRRALYGVR
jgi:hypothetical protein